MLFYNHAHVDASSTLLRPGDFPGKYFPYHNSEAVNVACVGNTVGIQNLNKTGKWSRMGKQARTDVSVVMIFVLQGQLNMILGFVLYLLTVKVDLQPSIQI